MGFAGGGSSTNGFRGLDSGVGDGVDSVKKTSKFESFSSRQDFDIGKPKGGFPATKATPGIEPKSLSEPAAGKGGNGWKVGDPVNAPTKKGDYPSWSTVKSRVWKNEATTNSDKYSPDDLAKMQKGRAPVHEDYGVSKEIHHLEGRGGNDPHRPENLKQVWPWEHADVDLFRVYKGPKP